jgi:hypothetical protein
MSEPTKKTIVFLAGQESPGCRPYVPRPLFMPAASLR